MPDRLDPSTLQDFGRRLRGLRADTPARWGRMDACAMLRHMRATLELSLGELEAPQLVPRWIGAPLGWIFTTLVTRWPRGLGGRRPPIAALCPCDGAPFDEERERLLAALARFAASLRDEPLARTPHPIFGPLSRRRWARVHALHLRHHLRQFAQ